MIHRLHLTANAFKLARSFGRGRVVSSVLAGRMLLTGRTGRFRVAAFAPVTVAATPKPMNYAGYQPDPRGDSVLPPPRTP